MKRYDKISNRYSLIAFGLLVFAIIYWSGKVLGDMPSKCKPSQEHQQVLEAISQMQTNIERQLSEMPLNCK